MALVVLNRETWESISTKKNRWSEEIDAVSRGEVVFIPFDGRKPDTMRVTLYESFKRAGHLVSVRSYTHKNVDGFAVAARSPKSS
jgi:hypothetical protein